MAFWRRLNFSAIFADLHHTQGVSTLARLGFSRHVADLRLVAAATITVFLVLPILALFFNFGREGLTALENSAGHHLPDFDAEPWFYIKLTSSALLDTVAFTGSIFPITFAVLTWAYRSGSSRLGIVDLFSAEISTLCRVITIVGMVERCTLAYDALTSRGPDAPKLPPMPSSRFLSAEHYTAIYDDNAKALQDLEVGVVVDAAQFYTYYKSMRDCLQRFVELNANAEGCVDMDPVRQALVDAIYMQFLALESGRAAIVQLIEFEPVAVKDTITILLSELLAFGFLMKNLRDDFRFARLQLRADGYRELVNATYHTAIHGQGHIWDKARSTAPELAARYFAVFQEHLDGDPAR